MQKQKIGKCYLPSWNKWLIEFQPSSKSDMLWLPSAPWLRPSFVWLSRRHHQMTLCFYLHPRCYPSSVLIYRWYLGLILPGYHTRVPGQILPCRNKSPRRISFLRTVSGGRRGALNRASSGWLKLCELSRKSSKSPSWGNRRCSRFPPWLYCLHERSLLGHYRTDLYGQQT